MIEKVSGYRSTSGKVFTLYADAVLDSLMVSVRNHRDGQIEMADSLVYTLVHDPKFRETFVATLLLLDVKEKK